MKTIALIASFVIALCFSSSSYGQGSGVYIGMGGSYVFENFDVDPVEIDRAHDPDFSNSWGLNLKLGYHFTHWFSLEFDFDHMAGFESEETRLNWRGVPVAATKLEAEVITYMAVAKLSDQFHSIYPFFVGGVGLMDTQMDAKTTVAQREVVGLPEDYRPASASDSETDVCAKLGLGLDLFPNESVSVGIEGAYVWGFNNVDQFRYFSLTLGVAYHY